MSTDITQNMHVITKAEYYIYKFYINLENDSRWNRRGTQKQPFAEVFQNRYFQNNCVGVSF